MIKSSLKSNSTINSELRVTKNLPQCSKTTNDYSDTLHSDNFRNDPQLSSNNHSQSPSDSITFIPLTEPIAAEHEQLSHGNSTLEINQNNARTFSFPNDDNLFTEIEIPTVTHHNPAAMLKHFTFNLSLIHI